MRHRDKINDTIETQLEENGQEDDMVWVVREGCVEGLQLPSPCEGSSVRG